MIICTVNTCINATVTSSRGSSNSEKQKQLSADGAAQNTSFDTANSQLCQHNFKYARVCPSPQRLNMTVTQLSQDTTALSHNDLFMGLRTEKSWVEYREGQPIYLFLLNAQTGYGVNPASCLIDTGFISRGLKWTGHKAGYSSP